MALTLAELQSARDALLRARAGGIRRVRDLTGEEVEYRSDAEMARALAALDSEIAALAKSPPSTFHFATSKGT
ncbi:hypothetical protein FIU89_14675 [Roseovarius sp. THAF27]|uniref:phage head-tail joining protein n=1 Tax=Roseovarius sp. THAF27 TaxID=2587850 RepID=UPI0012688392|nr:hypothetical protein [Roseovarius sp. THAF27]QFT81865.1 hypothetical protein FIU89_14675 [Roseovarius sp. THAF27]